jgi:hypothetical protein
VLTLNALNCSAARGGTRNECADGTTHGALACGTSEEGKGATAVTDDYDLELIRTPRGSSSPVTDDELGNIVRAIQEHAPDLKVSVKNVSEFAKFLREMADGVEGTERRRYPARGEKSHVDIDP